MSLLRTRFSTRATQSVRLRKLSLRREIWVCSCRYRGQLYYHSLEYALSGKLSSDAENDQKQIETGRMMEYQFIKEWNRKSGTFSSLMTPVLKPPTQFTPTFQTGAKELLDSLQGSLPAESTMRDSPSASDTGKGSDGDDNEQAPSRGGEGEHVSSARKRKRASSSALAGVVVAFQEMSAGIMRIEKENSERAKEAHEMAKDAHELEKRKFEFHQRKVEREEERADKFVGVLGQIAGAFRKMAEKM